MALIRGKHKFDDKYARIPNAWLRDSRLSLSAIGLLAQLMSHKPGWEITQENIAKSNNIGRDAVRTAINQLIDAGYLKRSDERQRNAAGHLTGYDYVTCDPMLDFPTLDKPTLDKPTLAEPTLDNPAHKKTITKKTINKKTIRKKRALPDDWHPKESVYSEEKYSVLDIDREAEAFRDWHLAQGSLFVDWDAAFRNWLKKGLDFYARKHYKEDERSRARRELDEWLKGVDGDSEGDG